MQKSFSSILFAILISITSNAQKSITPEEAAKHVGDSVKVCGKIFSGKFLESAKNQPTFLNMGAEYPNQQLTIVIWGDTRKTFSFAPEEKLKGKIVCITGRIEEFKGKPQIVIQDGMQLQED